MFLKSVAYAGRRVHMVTIFYINIILNWVTAASKLFSLGFIIFYDNIRSLFCRPADKFKKMYSR